MRKVHRIYLFPIISFLLLCSCGTLDNREMVGSSTNSSQVSAEDSSVGTSESSTEEEPIIVAAFEAQDLEGNTVSSEVFSESKLTMVNVWATYCNPCLREMPGLGELAGEYDPEEFQIIGIISDVQEGADQEVLDYASSLVEQTGADFTHLVLSDSLYYALLTNVTGVPTTFFIDEDGVILGAVSGSKDKSVWEEIVNALLEK